MVLRLPDEIIHKILSPGLYVSDDIFSLTHPSAPCSLSLRSSSATLLVCKSWLRVATPLLYNTVVLRTKGQAQALASALKSDPSLGRFIKKLRVEGGFAISMHKILQAAKNLTDIALTLEVAKGDTTSGLCRGIPLINPRRFLLACGPEYDGDDSGRGDKLVEVIVQNIPKWTNLVSFEMPAQYSPGWGNRGGGLHRIESISEAVALAPNLHTLVLSDFEAELFDNGFIPSYLSAIVMNPSLREIRPKARAQKALRPELLETVRGDEKLARLMNLDDFAIQPTSPFIYPPQLAADPTAEDAIWDRVLSFLYRDYLSKERSTDPDNEDYYERDPYGSDLPRRCLRPLLVCKKFLRLGTPYLYESPYVGQWNEPLRSFSRQLTSQPSLCLHVRRLLVRACESEDYQADLQSIFQRVPSMVGFSGVYDVVVSWATFETLSLQCGANLDTFLGVCVEKGPKKANPVVLSRFPRMETLAWESETAFETSPTLDAFGNLKYLIIKQAHTSFFTVLSKMELPSLRKVTLDEVSEASLSAFFAKHGHKVQELVINASEFDSNVLNKCLALKSLTIANLRDEICTLEKTFKVSDPHPLLERIAFDQRLFRNNCKADNEAIALFLKKFDLTPFPALREIQHGAFDWDRTDAEMVKLPWVKHLEKFQTLEIQLVDRPDAALKPRRLYVPKRSGKRNEK